MWAITRWNTYRARYAALAVSPPRPGMRIVRLCTRAEVDSFVRTQGGHPG